jgi:hypothetical protein
MSSSAFVEWMKLREAWADHMPGNPGDLLKWLLGVAYVEGRIRQ